MDPNGALAEIRELIHADEPNAAMIRFEVLDEWLSKGGFLPREWSAQVCDLCPHAEDHDHREGTRR